MPLTDFHRSSKKPHPVPPLSSLASSPTACRPCSFPPPSAPPASTDIPYLKSFYRHSHSPPQRVSHVRSNTQTLGKVLSTSGARMQATSSDREKIRSTTRVINLASQYLRRKTGTSFSSDLSSTLSGQEASKGKPSTSNGARFGTIRPVPRQYLNYHVRQRENGAWQATVSLVQPFVRGLWTDPQGTRPGYITMGFYSTEQGALAACCNHAPPVWAEPLKESICYMCLEYRKKMYRSPLHCRNCGQLVCPKCSKSRWPRGMLPSTYHNNESTVRVCDACNHLAWNFRRALKEGDRIRALELFASGNLNIWMPFIIESVREYPVHCAAEGGNLDLLRWLVNEFGCPLYETADGASPLLTHRGDSVLGVASRHRRVTIMRWLVQEKGCKISEIIERRQLWDIIDFLLKGNAHNEDEKDYRVVLGGDLPISRRPLGASKAPTSCQHPY